MDHGNIIGSSILNCLVNPALFLDMDDTAVHLQTERLRHELVVDPRVQRLQHRETLTPTQLNHYYPTVNAAPRSSVKRSYSTTTVMGPGTYPIPRKSWKPTPRRRSLANPMSDCIIILIALSLIPCLIGLILEGVAFAEDGAWNAMITDGEEFPSLDASVNYFDNKKLMIDTSDANLNEVKNLMLRDGSLEPLAISCVVISICVVVLALVMYHQGEVYKKVVVWCHIPVGILILGAAICIFISDDNIDTDHLKAAAKLELFLHDIMDYQNHAHFMQFSIESIEEIAIQTLNLIAIEKMCALGLSNEGRFAVVGRTTQYIYLLEDKTIMHKITLDDLHSLRFCSMESLKHGAGSVLLIYFVLCNLIPLIHYCREYSRAVKVAAEADTFDIGEAWAVAASSMPPPAYGYGKEESTAGDRDGQLIEEKYDVRNPPKPPKIPLDEVLEMEYVQLALLHRRAMETAGDDDFKSASAVSIFGGGARSNRRQDSRGESPASTKTTGKTSKKNKKERRSQSAPNSGSDDDEDNE